MINVDVELDDRLVRCVSDRGWDGMRAAWQREAETLGLQADSLLRGDVAPGEAETAELQAICERLKARRVESIQRLRPFLPPVKEDIRHRFRVLFLPNGAANFSPRDGLQIFSLHPDADPLEAFLFLVHVYYHEISSINYTDRCRACSERIASADDFRYWIKLLIRNEGIANYAVLPELLELRKTPHARPFRYFTYAPQIGDETSLRQSTRVLERVFSLIDEGNYALLRGQVNQVLKNESLSVINLIGVHMAEAIAASKGLEAMISVHQRPPTEFFELYALTPQAHSLPVNV